MKKLEDNSVDTIITDPPYGLSFMGKKWDYDVPSIEIWKECLRVLKPGGTALIFGGSRTYHRMAIRVEDAGFILKDCIMWIYGSGFPKATDISKQLDKGVEREKILNPLAKQQTQSKGTNAYGDYAATKYIYPIPITPEAKLWNGWKSHGLKPAYEPIIVAIKPNEGSYAENALKWGVSGLNIDGGRVGTTGSRFNGRNVDSNIYGKYGTSKPKENYNQGRFPANIILDEEAGEMLDEQSGILKSGDNCVRRQEGFFGEHGGLGKAGDVQIAHGDKGGASRFFYTAKASKSERNEGIDTTKFSKTVGHNRFDQCATCGKYILQNQNRPSACKCGTPNRQDNIIKGNFHPTVKPVELMGYLCKLTKTPTGGIVLDPFIGSGTTAIASRRENRPFIGFEIDEEYYKICDARVKKEMKQKFLGDFF